MEAELRFRAMGSDVHVIVHGDPQLAQLARVEIERLEQLWSRFLPTSEVSALNRDAGRWVEVSDETLDLVERALAAHRATGGRFDPTVLGDVIRAGYDRSYEQLAALGDRPAPTSPLGRGASHIGIDRELRAVRLPVGCGFDPGGLGKGLAADRVGDLIDRHGAAGVLVNVGGDLRASGIGPGGEDWTVALDPAMTGHPLATVVLDHGAVATSTVLRRRWQVEGTEHHHLIDPATGRPAARGVVAASILAATGWQAEALSKAALVAGIDEGRALVESLGADGLLVDHHGGLHPTSGFDRFLVAPRTPEVQP